MNDGTDDDIVGDFLYDYTVPQLNKEFDLLKFSDDICVNIELKSQMISEDRIQAQLLHNAHFLKMFGKQLFLFAYVSSENKLFILDDDGELVSCGFTFLRDILNSMNAVRLDPDATFTPKNILVSPLNSPEKFFEGKYLLTEHQFEIKNKIVSSIIGDRALNYAITGGPGTGKTLLVYDIAKTLSANFRVTIVHCGMLCGGHDHLNKKMHNISIRSVSDVSYRSASETLSSADVVIIDEAHRMYALTRDEVIKFCKDKRKYCIYSYDSSQILSKSEEARDNAKTIEALCRNTKYKLKNKIRTNKELALFITCLFDLSKFRREYAFKHVNIIYESDFDKACDRANILQTYCDYTYIGYTPSTVYMDLNNQKTDVNTHKVIGQEFDKVCMILNDYFCYEYNVLKCHEHPNPDYIFTKLLYQGLTRVRSELTLIVTEKSLLQNILTLFPPAPSN